jgi:hypothetical protein
MQNQYANAALNAAQSQYANAAQSMYPNGTGTATSRFSSK